MTTTQGRNGSLGRTFVFDDSSLAAGAGRADEQDVFSRRCVALVPGGNSATGHCAQRKWTLEMRTRFPDSVHARRGLLRQQVERQLPDS